jgi:hypothetical protein
MSSKSNILLLATFTTGVMSGLFYGSSVVINPALSRLPDAAYTEAMQAINDAIQNPWFGFIFSAHRGYYWVPPSATSKRLAPRPACSRQRPCCI